MSWPRLRKVATLVLLLAVAGLAAFAQSGCERSPSGALSGGVAVIDLQQVAAMTGRDAVIAQQLDATRRDIDARLNTVREQLQKDLEAKRQAFGEKPTAEQEQEFGVAAEQAEQQFRQELVGAQQQSERTRASLVGQFREEVRPIAEGIALARGLSVVLVRDESVLAVHPAVDLTSEVIERMRAEASGGAPAQSPLAAPSAPPGPGLPGLPRATYAPPGPEGQPQAPQPTEVAPLDIPPPQPKSGSEAVIPPGAHPADQ